MHAAIPDTACRILVLSTNIQEAQSLIQLLRDYKKDASVHRDNQLKGNDIPWVIENRYYTAAVHFRLHPLLQGDDSEPAPSPRYEGVPAVIWVWRSGQSYQDYVQKMKQDMEDCGAEPEVLLGVKIPAPADPDDINSTAQDDDSEIDSYLSSNGFEYIDATKEETEESRAEAYSDGIPGLPRVFDALGTIMWSSMAAASRSKAATSSARQARERALLDWAHASQGMVSDDEELAQDETVRPGQAMQKEMLKLQRWLEESDEPLTKEDPWRSAVSTAGALSSSPTAMDFDSQSHGTTLTAQGGNGFDDDFTVFVSAPPLNEASRISSKGASARSTPDLSRGQSLGVPGGSLYRSLGSVSDFGGSDGQSDLEDNDGVLPTKREIEEMSHKIFGKAKVQTAALETKDFERNSKESQQDYEMAPFDLTRVLGALQGMKAEIASIEDEDERRNAAARVALGLVYGLELDDE